ncbi:MULTISPECIES: hypothetical protein [unclassified Lysobacter]
MPQLRIRITGGEDDARAIADLLTSIPGIEHVEEISGLMPHMDDPDSSSAGSIDNMGPGTHVLEIEAPDNATAQKVRETVEALAFDLEVLVEFESAEAEQ